MHTEACLPISTHHSVSIRGLGAPGPSTGSLIRHDIAANLGAVDRLESQHGDVDLTLVESGGDNLTAIFSRGLVDVEVFVIATVRATACL